MNQFPDELTVRVDNLDKAVFGDRVNPKETPGALAELAQMNVTLRELRDAMQRINWTIIFGFLTALLAVVFKGIST